MDTNLNAPDNFSLLESGPVHRVFVKMNLDKHRWKLAIVLWCITWLPLAIITAIEGTLYSRTQMPFLDDVAIQLKLLVALPMLLMIGPGIDQKVRVVVKYLSETLMSADESEHVLAPALYKVKNRINSALAEVILLLIVITISISPAKGGVMRGEEGNARSWMFAIREGKQVLNLAGNWVVYISIPVFQFILIRWIWKYIVWMLLLLRISRMKLDLKSTHPDQAGGLGILILPQQYFLKIFFAISIAISGELIVQLTNGPGSFTSIRNQGIGCIILCLFLVLLPLFFFMGKLIKTKNGGLVDLGQLGGAFSYRFDKDWINTKPIETRVSENVVDPSMLIDYSSIYSLLRQLRLFLFTPRDIIVMAIILFIPFIPILFIRFSVMEILQKIVGLLG